jgi:hypothetical protein
MNRLPQSTPEFVAWCVVRRCGLRQRFEVADPLATERHLKGLRAASEARHAGRVIGDWCLARRDALESDDPRSDDRSTDGVLRGFSWTEVTAGFGGSDRIDSDCARCPANLLPLADGRSRGWAGCFGWLVLDRGLTDLPVRLFADEPAVTPSAAADRWAALLSSSPLVGSRALDAATRLQQIATGRTEAPETVDLPERGSEPTGSADPLVAALLEASRSTRDDVDGAVALRHLPAGIVDGRSWTWPSRCRRCLAAKPVAGRCSRCEDDSPPLTPVRRRSRGTRPYRDLGEVLPESELAELREALRRAEGFER